MGNNLNQEQLLQEMSEMRAELASYKTEISSLTSQVNSLKQVLGSKGAEPKLQNITSRRRMLKTLAVGAAATGALAFTTANVNKAYAASYDPAANAIEATPAAAGYGGLFQTGGLANIRLAPASTAKFANGTPTDGNSHQAGELYVDSDGTLYYCYSGTGSDSGKWRILAGTSTSGSLILFSNPDRFVQTNYQNGTGYGIGTNPGVVNGFTPLWAPASLSNTTYVKTYPLAGQTGQNNKTIPANATGVLGFFSVQAMDSSTNGGFATLWPAGQSFPPTSTTTFNAVPQYTSTQFSCSLGTGGAVCVASRNTVHVVIDIAGYYL